MVEGGRISRTGDYEVGAGINLSSKLVMGGGYALKLPVIDISEIGAGGGSIVSLDRGGLLKVGPQSAGALPGPVCYGGGGEDPTFTDSVLTLGFLNPGHLVGGSLELDADAARDALQKKIAGPLGHTLQDTAWGVYQVACGTMVRAVKAVSTYRGRDPPRLFIIRLRRERACRRRGNRQSPRYDTGHYPTDPRRVQRLRPIAVGC